MSYISLLALRHVLWERRLWAFCAAMATTTPMPVGPNLRRLA